MLFQTEMNSYIYKRRKAPYRLGTPTEDVNIKIAPGPIANLD